MAENTRVETYRETTLIADHAASSSVVWPAIFGGAIAALAMTFILLPLGSALGLAAASPWNHYTVAGLDAKGFTVTTAIWLIIVQWLSSGVGGYLTGRLRSKWAGAHTHEAFFRDTAHGFITWGLATILILLMLALTAPIANSMGAAQGAAQTATAVVQDNNNSSPEWSSAQSGAQPANTDEVRRAMAKASLLLFISLLIGAFISTAAAALGGAHRDVHYHTGSLKE